MSVDRTEVKTFLKNWANTTSKPHFAVLLEGRWGCGKTHFVKELLKDNSFTERKSIYLSVFGISDIQSLETSLFYASASKATKTLHKGIGLAGSIFSGALTLSSGGILGGTANLNKVVDEATIQLEKSAKKMDGAVLVLDDLERCRIPMSELLGVVNRFVEHGDTRVILCANTDNFKDERFSTFKEKVVGHSFLLESKPDSALQSFIKEIVDRDVSEIILQYENDILKLYEKSGYHNLRALRQFIWQLGSIVEKIKEDYRKNEDLIQKLIIQFFIFFIEFKLNLADGTDKLSPSDLLGKNDQNNDEVRYVFDFSFDEDREPTPKQRVFTKYEQHTGIRTVITVQQWISILTSGVVDAARLNSDLAKSDEVAGVASWPSWRRLWHLHSWDFSDNSEPQFWSDVGDMQSKLRDGDYVELGEFLHVVGVSLMLAEHQLIEQSVGDVVAQMKAYIDRQFIPNLTDERCRLVSKGLGWHLDSYDGLGFIGREDAEFKDVLDYLKQAVAEWERAWLAKDAGEQLLGYLTDDWLRFFGNLTVINHAPEQRYLETPILATIDVATFVDAWLSLSRHDERLVVRSIKGRYEYHPELLDAEGPWWRTVQVELNQRIENSTSKPRNYQINDIIGQINSSIIEKWELRQFEQFSSGNLTDLGWMTRKRVIAQ